MFSRRSVGTTTYAAASAMVVLLAVTSHVEPVRKAELNDGGVWLSSGKDHGVGRYIKSIGQLDAAIYPPSDPSDVDVLQDAGQVLAWDQSAGTLFAVDVQKRQLVGDGAPMPRTSLVSLGGGTLASVTDKGELRMARVGSGQPDPATVSAAAAPAIKGLKGPLMLAVGQDGSVAVTSKDKLIVVHVEGGSFTKPTSTRLPVTSKPRDLTFVGSEPVVLDTGSHTLMHGKTTVKLSIGDQERLQQPGPSARTVVVAGALRAALVDLSTGDVNDISTAGDGVPVAPVRMGRCVYAAWSTGTNVASCNDQPAKTMSRAKNSSGSLVYRVNRRLLLLNDKASGLAWDVDEQEVTATPQLWQKVQEKLSSAGNVPSRKKQRHKGDNLPPRARPDTYGARVGHATVLNVLDNDVDPEGDLLVVSGVTKPDLVGVTAVPAPDGQSVIVTVPSGTPGDVHFSYTVDDGHGKSASAAVTVQPRTSNQNQPPRIRSGYEALKLTVAPGGRLRLPVLPDWRDYDGDPLAVASASPASQVVPTDDGTLLITAPMTAGTMRINYTVTDGLSAPAAATPIVVQVLDAGSTQPFAKPLARPDALRITVGQPATISPLANDLPGADATDPQAHLALAKPVTGAVGIRLTTDRSRGTVTALADRPGTYLLTYDLSFGAAPQAVGDLRIDAVPAVGQAGSPVAMPDQAVAHGQKPVLVDVLANDYDPAGGVLVVQDARGDTVTGVSAGVVDGRYLRIAATGIGQARSASVSYRVSNGRAPAVTGLVSVTLLPAAERNIAPVAMDDSVVVRAGDSAIIPVLDNDFDPDGDALSLLPVSITARPALPGLQAAAAGRTVRVAVASSVTRARQVLLDYFVIDPSGARTRGRVSVSVVPSGGKDQPPTPRDLEGRLIAGDTQVLRVPVYGVDPDGDSVAVTQVTSAPSLGRIVKVEADRITYQAYPSRGGTDSFTYEVTDPFGRTGQAVVRLGVVPPGALAGPIAVDDQVAAMPGRLVHVDVTLNDIAPPGGHLTVLPLARFGKVPAGVRLDGSVITVPVPVASAPLVVPYAITAGSGTVAAADLVVRGQAKALLPPVAQDDRVSRDARGTSIAVDVLRNDDDPDGSRDDLAVSSVNKDAHVRDGRLVVPLGETARQFAYVITDADHLVGMAVVHVPAFAVKRTVTKAQPPPHLKPGAHIALPGGGSVNVSLASLVEDPLGKPVRLTTTDHMSASPVTGVHVSTKSINAVTVAAIGKFSGPGAVSFQVTTGTTLQDKNGRMAQITVPVQVGKNQPTLSCPNVPLEIPQGGAAVPLDLATLCHVWVDPNDRGALHLKASLHATTSGVTATASGSTSVVLTAQGAAAPGPAGTLTVSVPGTSVSASMPVRVVAAPKLTVRPVAIPALRAGQDRSIDLARYVSSPLRDPKIAVIGLRMMSGEGVQSSFKGTTVTLSPGRDAKGSFSLAVTVTDVPGQAARQVELPLSATVQGRPAAPVAPAVVGVASKQATLSWATPEDNGAPIEHYNVAGSGRTVACQASPCTIDGLTNGTTYRFTVVAVNAVGESDPSPQSAGATPDAVPGTVTTMKLTPGDQSMQAAWDPPPNEGTAITKYQVEVQPAPAAGALLNVTSPNANIAGLQNGVSYAVRVRAQNRAEANQGFGEWSAAVSEVPFGQPPQMPPPSATGADVPNPAAERAITVSWAAANGNGRDIASYTITQYVDSSAGGSFSQQVDQVTGSPSAFSGGGGFSKSFTVKNDGKFYTFTVFATNAGERSSPPSGKSNAVQGAAPPDQVSSVTATDHAAGGTAGYDGAIHVSFAIPKPNATSIDRVEYQINGTSGSWPSPGAPGTTIEKAIGSLTNGTSYTVTVRGCNDAQKCGPWSEPSNAVIPYGPPNVPGVSASASGTTFYYNWSGGGGNGRPISSYTVCVDGGCGDQGANAGSGSRGFACGTTHSVYAYVTDTAGQRSGNSGTATAATQPCAPPPSVSVSWGGRASSSICGGDTSCTYITVSWANFSAGSHAIHPTFDGGYWGYPDQSRSGTSGSITGVWAAGYCGQSHVASANVDGVGSSNSVNTTEHGC